MHRLTTYDLNRMDFGAHTFLMEEWNETSKFVWGDATLMHDHPHSTVVHEYTVDGNQGIMVAVYLTDGEGDLLSLRVYDRYRETGQHDYIGKVQS